MADKLFIDRQSEVHALLQDHAEDTFDRFDDLELDANAVYLVGRMEMSRCGKLIRQAIENQCCRVVFSNPAEGSKSLLDQLDRLQIRDLVFDKKLAVLGGGDIEPGINHCQHENFLFLTSIEPKNQNAVIRTGEIFSKVNKPYRFLFLNGRLRPHRKWLIESMREKKLLDVSLWSCLHATHGARSPNLKFIRHGQDLMQVPEKVQLLPPQYELPELAQQRSAAQSAHWAKPILFETVNWADSVINADCYIDTYFSVVTETVFDYEYSFRTEKIWKPIMMGHPWICVANAGFYRDMRKLGFQTFGSIIDESFDDIIDHQQRIQRVSDIISDLAEQDLVSFLQACEPICKYNQQHFLEQAPQIGRSFAKKFLDFLDHLYQS